MNHYGTWADTRAWDANVPLSPSTISPRCAERTIPPEERNISSIMHFYAPPRWNRFITAARTYSDAPFIVNFCTRGKSRRCQRLSCSVRDAEAFLPPVPPGDLHSCRASIRRRSLRICALAPDEIPTCHVFQFLLGAASRDNESMPDTRSNARTNGVDYRFQTTPREKRDESVSVAHSRQAPRACG